MTLPNIMNTKITKKKVSQKKDQNEQELENNLTTQP